MTKISHNIYAVDGLEILFPGHIVIPYIIEEGRNDLTLIDTCYIRELPKLETFLNNIGYEMTDIKRIILTHAHADHTRLQIMSRSVHLFLQIVKQKYILIG
jgi:glyoxylase-like metal-dependent hydrolase (beta-lactamase superfamily II)